jgi:hypothetical protein
MSQNIWNILDAAYQLEQINEIKESTHVNHKVVSIDNRKG